MAFIRERPASQAAEKRPRTKADAARQAAFAFLLARETTGKMTAAYRPGESSRDGLMLDPQFAAAFREAKARIRAMEYRYVEETDQNLQALLEIYCAIALGTPYNDFGTH